MNILGAVLQAMNKAIDISIAKIAFITKFKVQSVKILKWCD